MIVRRSSDWTSGDGGSAVRWAARSPVWLPARSPARSPVWGIGGSAAKNIANPPDGVEGKIMQAAKNRFIANAIGDLPEVMIFR